MKVPIRLAAVVALACASAPAAMAAALLQAPATAHFVPALAARRSELVDFDGDGRLDLAVGSTHGLRLFRNLSGNQWSAPDSVLPGVDVSVLGVGHADGGGVPDLFVTERLSSESRIRILFGTGSSFAPSATWAVAPSGSNRVPADFDGDGRVDVLSHHVDGSSLQLFLNDGAGGFVAQVMPSLPFEPANGARVGDLDGDGDPDFTLSSGVSDSIATYLNDGDGTFAPPLFSVDGNPLVFGHFDAVAGLDGIFTSPLGFRSGNGAGGFGAVTPLVPSLLYFDGTAGDMNGDGKDDLVGLIQTGAEVMRVSIGHGDGTFTLGDIHPAGANPIQPRLGDVDGDGSLDVLVTGQLARAVNLFQNQGDGTFGMPRVETTRDLRDVELADLDGDGDPDLLAVDDIAGHLTVWRNPGDGAFTLAATHSTGFGARVAMTARLDAGAALDVLVVRETGELLVYLNDGAGNLLAPASIAVGGTPRGIASGDLDGDGDLDLVVPSTGTTARVWLGDGLGGFNGGQTLTATTGTFDRVALGRFDAGATLDVAIANGSRVVVHPGAGNGTFGAASVLLPLASGTASTLEAADADGDGDTDLFAVTSAGSVAHWRNDAGTFAPRVDLSSRTYPDFSFQPVIDLRVRDFDADGAPDLVAAPAGHSRAIGLLDGTAPGSFAPVRHLAGFYEPRAIDSGDVDGDGDLDLVMGCVGNAPFNAPGTIVTLLNLQDLVGVPGPTPGPAATVSLAAAWPSPARGGFSIRYRLAQAGPVRVEVVSVDGRRRLVREDAPATAGEHVLRLDDRAALPAGIHWVTVSQGAARAARKVVVLP